MTTELPAAPPGRPPAGPVVVEREKTAPGRSWHWDLYARVLAGLRTARGEQGPCAANTLAAAEAVMAELAPVTELLARVPVPRIAVSPCSAGPR